MSDLTVLLDQARGGDAGALDRVFEALYEELAMMARSRLRRGERVTLADTGALVHESWMRLRQSGRLNFEDRGHFLAHAAQVMRSVIVDIAAGKGPEGVGGNCPLTEAGNTVVKHGVTLVGETNLPALVATDSSALYARNVLDFLKLIVTKEGALAIPADDDIVTACMVTRDGQVLRS
jgi:hypothetical protein